MAIKGEGSELVVVHQGYLAKNALYLGDSRELLSRIEPKSIDLSFWSPPYFVGKSYENDLSYADWESMLKEVISKHNDCLKPGGFLAINIADILCFKDPEMPKIAFNNISRKKHPVTKADVLQVKKAHPNWTRYRVAEELGCSEQTVQRRLEGVNVRGGKYESQTKVKLVGNIIQQFAEEAGFYLLDRRIWVKDPAWANSQWHSTSFKSIDEFEYIFIFWKPGETDYVRSRLTKDEWISWGSRAVWRIPSVHRNHDHEAKFPIDLARRVIRLFTDEGDTVLDPFAGSGTTVMAAKEMSREWIGIEIMPAYHHLASKNVSNHPIRKGHQLHL